MTDPSINRLRKIADTDYEIFPLLKQRYSPRIFQKVAIQEAHLRKLFEAARWSASSFNRQPWRFIYAHSATQAYDKIANCLNDKNQSWASHAPLLMISIYKHQIEEGGENFHALHDLGLCLGSMTVQAQYMGIALHHLAGIDRDKAAKEFDIPEGYKVATAIAVGYYGGDPDELPEKFREMEFQKRSRMEQTEFAFREGWKKTGSRG